MPDHLHWLVRILPSGLLSGIVRNVKAGSARRLRQSLGATDAIWQSGFHDHAMRRDEDIVATARYIIANPVRAELVKKVGDYPLWDAAWV